MISQLRLAERWVHGRRNFIYRWAHVLAPLILLVFAVGLRIGPGAFAENLRNKVFDQMQRIKPRAYEPAPVRIVDIDDASLAAFGQWPWPRNLLAKLVNRLKDEGAAVVVFDMVFAEPDRTSPARLASFLPDEPALSTLKDKLRTLPDHDALFAKAMASSRVVTGFALTVEENSARPLSKASFAISGDDPIAYLHDFPGAVTNLPLLERAAAGNGNFGYIPETDAVIRRAPLLFRQGENLLPSLSAEALRVAQGASNYAVKSAGGSGEWSFGQHTGISKIKIGRFVVPTDAQGRMWVYYTGPAPERTISVKCAFDKGCSAGKFKDAMAFVGTSAMGLKDQRATPLSSAAPGVEVHANAAEQILLGRYLRRPDLADGAEILYMLLWGLILICLLARLGAAWGALAAAAGIGGAFAASWHAFLTRHYLIDPLFPSLTVLVVYMSSSLVSYLKSESERRQVRSAFGQYLHPRLVEELARHPEKLKLGGETREMTVLFCDIRGFTTISEQYDAHGLTQVINQFLTPMTSIIMDRMGYIDKYIGDCIMAFWNAPADDPEHAVHACRSALEMHRRLEGLNALWESEAEKAGRKFIPIHIGVGLNAGPCCVGNMGSDQKFNYSVLGDDVNLASRLEGQSKTYGVDTVLGPRIREQAPDFPALELDLIRVKGKTVPVRIYGLLGDEDLKLLPEFHELEARHQEMLAAYRKQDWDKAEDLINRKLIPLGSKPPFKLSTLYSLYSKRVAAYRSQAPAADWDGTFTATTK